MCVKYLRLSLEILHNFQKFIVNMRFVRKLHLDLRKEEQSKPIGRNSYQLIGTMNLVGFHSEISFLRKFGFSTGDDSRLLLSVISANDGQSRIPLSVGKLKLFYEKNVELKSIRRNHELLSLAIEKYGNGLKLRSRFYLVKIEQRILDLQLTSWFRILEDRPVVDDMKHSISTFRG
jgi:hypothetical protein